MKNLNWLRILGFLIVIFITSAVLKKTQRYTFERDHSITSYGPSGTAAFARLLSESGFKVNIVKNARETAKQAILITEADSSVRIPDVLKRIPAGSRVLALKLGRRLDGVSPLTVTSVATGEPFASIPVESPKDGSYTPTDTKTEAERQEAAERDRTGVVRPKEISAKDFVDRAALFSIYERPLVYNWTYKNVRVTEVIDAGFIMNQNININDSAAFAMTLTNLVAGESKELDLISGLVGSDNNQSLTQELGPAVHGLYTQALIFAAALLVMFNVRFGTHGSPRVHQRGQREFINSISIMAKDSHQYKWALKPVWERTISKYERQLRIPREKLVGAPEAHVAPEQSDALRRLRDIINADELDPKAVKALLTERGQWL